MSKLIFVAFLALILCQANGQIKKCKSVAEADPSDVIEEKIMNFVLKEKLHHNPLIGYDTYRAQNLEDNTAILVKLYLRPTAGEGSSSLEKFYWAYSDNPADPPKECDQMKKINDLLRAEGITDIKFEECVSDDEESSTEGSSMPYVNAFERANGEPLSNYCIFNSCRTKLQKISTLILKGLKVLANGAPEYYEVNQLNEDNIFYFDMGPTKYLTFTDMKYNAVPVTDQKLAPWLKDMDKVGKILAKLLARSCDFVVSDASRSSTLNFYQQIHYLHEYDHNDVDIGVNPMLGSSSTQDPDEKKAMLNNSIYDFILKLLSGPNQFTDPAMALQHNFITQAASTRIDRPSDMS